MAGVILAKEKFGDPRDMSLDDMLEYCMHVTNKTPEEQALHSTKAQYAGVYLTWKCLYNEFGAEEAERLYWECWKQLLKLSYDKATKKLGITKPKTARDLGRIHREFFLDVPSRYKVVSDTVDEWIADVLWCPNPKLGPADVHSLRMLYYSTEYALSLKVNEYVIELAGLQNEIEHEQPTTMCACAQDTACRMIYRKRKR